MEDVQHERRARRRFPVTIQIAILPSAELPVMEGTTRDVSSGGVFFYIDPKLKPAPDFDFILTLPSDIAPPEVGRIACHGRVVRVEEGAEGLLGIAAKIEKVRFGGETLNVP